MTKLGELLAHLMICPMGGYDLKPDDRAWLRRMAELAVEVVRSTDGDVATGLRLPPDREPGQAGVWASRHASVTATVLAILRSPEGRAAIAGCMRRPPVRMVDGTWREPTPGSEAKPGDVVRFLASNRGGDVWRVDGETLWIRGEGGVMETARADAVEVTWTAEMVPVRAAPIARERQATPPTDPDRGGAP